MIKFENDVRIEQPVEDVFAFAADPRNFPKWNYYVLSVTSTSPGPIGPGSTFRQIRKSDRQELRIQEFRQNKLVDLETSGGGYPQLRMRLEFKPDEGGTLIQDTWQLETGLPDLAEKIARRKIKHAVEDNLTKLKQLLEDQEVVLQDGRRMTVEEAQGGRHE